MVGTNKAKVSFKVRVTYPSFMFYDTADKSWHRPPKANNNMLQMRRNHVAVVVNTDLVIHGGIDDGGNILSS